MPISSVKAIMIAATLGAGALLCGCTESRLREAPDFGEAVRQDVVGQIADPDAHYAGRPAPASTGMRVDAAEERYVHGKVIEPAATSTSTAVVGTNGPGGGSGGPTPSGGQ